MYPIFFIILHILVAAAHVAYLAMTRTQIPKKPQGGFLVNCSDDGTYKIGIGLKDGVYIEDVIKQDYIVLEVDKDFIFPDSHVNHAL